MQFKLLEDSNDREKVKECKNIANNKLLVLSHKTFTSYEKYERT